MGKTGILSFRRRLAGQLFSGKNEEKNLPPEKIVLNYNTILLLNDTERILNQ